MNKACTTVRTCFVEMLVGLALLRRSDLPCPSLVPPSNAAGFAGSAVTRIPVTVHGRPGG